MILDILWAKNNSSIENKNGTAIYIYQYRDYTLVIFKMIAY